MGKPRMIILVRHGQSEGNSKSVSVFPTLLTERDMCSLTTAV
jgi:broad specificity phosphatase PhoE